jgi:hypothetical protein
VESGELLVGKVGECDVENYYLKVVAPTCVG